MGKTVWGAAVLMAAGMALAGCGEGQGAGTAPVRQAAPESAKPDRYAYSASVDLAGVYEPADDYVLRNWRLKQVIIGNADAFTTWDATGRAASAAPVKLVFEDRQDINPGTGQARTLTLIPAAFDLDDRAVVIEAVSGGLGEVRFDGARGGLSEAAALKGQLKIGTQIFENTELKLKTGG